MHLVQLLLPLSGNDGRPTTPAELRRVRDELTDRFGGLTAYSRSPAEGLWEEPRDGERVQDDVVIYEVMVERLDPEWWSTYRASLEHRFQQDELVIRAVEMRRL